MKKTENTNVTLRGRSGRVAFAVVVCACLLVIGRNLYRRYLDNALVNAVEVGNVRAVRNLLDRGANANSAQTFEDGKFRKSALYLAMESGRRSEGEQIACLLIEHGADIHEKSPISSSCLQTACQGGSVALVRDLLEHGANPEQSAYYNSPVGATLAGNHDLRGLPENGYKLTPAQMAQRLDISRQMVNLLRQHGAQVRLPDAVQMEDAALTRQLLASGVNVNEEDANRKTALEWAMRTGNPRLMQRLLARGANPNAAASMGGTLLNMAARSGDLNAARLLLAHGAKVNPDDTQYPPPLTSAMQGKNSDVARLLLAHGANPNAAPCKWWPDLTPLTAAIENLPALVPDLLAHHAAVNGTSGSPLVAAIRAHNPGMTRFLLQHGAKIQPPVSRVIITTTVANLPGAATSPHPQIVTTPSTLRVAVTDGPECFELLMQAGADITPDKPDILLAAASAGRALLFDRLISLGANVNAGDEHGRTPLTEAISHAPDGVKTLLEHGANPNIVIQPEQQQAWQTPLIMAVQQVRPDLVRLLLAHGANVTVKPPRSHTALYFARRHKKPDADIVKLLEQAGAKAE